MGTYNHGLASVPETMKVPEIGNQAKSEREIHCCEVRWSHVHTQPLGIRNPTFMRNS